MKIIFTLFTILFINSNTWANIDIKTTVKIYKQLVQSNKILNAPGLAISSDPFPNAHYAPPLIVINKGMLKKVSNKAEMAWVLGHELGHHYYHHTESNWKNEYLADSKSLVYMKKAGYNICVGTKIVKKFKDKGSEDHPPSNKRYERVRCK